MNNKYEISTKQQVSNIIHYPSFQNPEVSEVKHPRKFSRADKLRILAEAEKCTKQAELGALLRREGIYRGYLHKWKVQRDNGTLKEPHGKRTQIRPDDNDMFKQLNLLKKQNTVLEKRLKLAEAVIEGQKKISEIVGLSLVTQNLSEAS